MLYCYHLEECLKPTFYKMFKTLKFGFDLCLVSTTIAGISKANNIEIKTDLITEPIIKKSVDVYLSVGDYFLQRLAVEARKYPEYFRFTINK